MTDITYPEFTCDTCGLVFTGSDAKDEYELHLRKEDEDDEDER